MAELEGINAGEFGKTVQLVCKKDGVVQNVSGFNTISIKFWSPKPVKRIQQSGTYTSTGAGVDGIVEFAFSSDVYPDRVGRWDGQLWLEKSGSLVKSDKFIMEVGE